MGMTRTQLTAIAKATGYPVKAAWVTGHGTMGDVAGVMLHHTATSDSAPGDYPSYNIVRQGRSDLPGPLCNFGLGRSGTIYLVSDGIAWHAGPGAWRGVTLGNTHFLGIEAENAGTGRPWPQVQLDAYQRLVASILHTIGRGTNWDVRHAAWALPAGRKTDTAGIPMDAFDAAVTRMLRDPRTINRNYAPTPAPAPTPPEDPMPTPDDLWSWSAPEYGDLDDNGKQETRTASDTLWRTARDAHTAVAVAADARDTAKRTDAKVDALGAKLDALLAKSPPAGQ